MQSLGYKVTFIPLNLAYLGHYQDELNKLGIETIHSPFCMAVEDFLRDRGSEFDVVYITRYNVANRVIDMVRKLAPRSKVLFCNADLHFLREIRAAVRSGDEIDWKRAETTREEELLVMREVDVVLSYNEVEHSVILSHNMLASTVMTCPWVVETPPRTTFRRSRAVAASPSWGDTSIRRISRPSTSSSRKSFRGSARSSQASCSTSTAPPCRSGLRRWPTRPSGQSDTSRRSKRSTTPTGSSWRRCSAVPGSRERCSAPLRTESRPSCHRWLSRAPGSATAMTAWSPATSMEWNSSIVRLYDDPVAWTRMSLSAREFTMRQYSFENGRVLMRRAFEAAGGLHARP